MNKFIVDLYKFNKTNGIYEEDGHALVYLFENDIDNEDAGTIRVVKDKTIVVDANLKEHNVCISNKSKSLLNTIEYEIIVDTNKFGISFDSRSTSASDLFFEKFSKIKKEILISSVYPSGRIQIEGHQLDGLFNGLCVEYYDISTSLSKYKYIGEFENNYYDGSGTFYSSCGNIEIIANNICNDKPNGKGLLIVNNFGKIDKTELDFNDLKLKNLDATSDNYCLNVSKLFYDPDVLNDITDYSIFSRLSITDKVDYLFKELQKMKKDNDTNNKLKKKSIFNLF